MKAKISTSINLNIIAKLAFAMVLFFVGVNASAADNLLTNSSFEDGFTDWENWMPENNFIETNAENVNSGTQSIALKPVGWSGAGFGHTFEEGFAAGETYTLSAYGKIFGEIGTEQADIFIQFIDAEDNRTTESSPTFSKTDSFEVQSITAIVPEGTVKMVVGTWFGGPDETILFLDDFSFIKGMGGLSVVNPGFEDGLNGWENWMPDNNVVETNLENVHSGNQSIVMKPVGWSGAGFGQTFTEGFTAGEAYTLSAYGKIFGEIGTDQADVFIQFFDIEDNRTTESSPRFTKTDSFELQSVTAIVPEGTVKMVVGTWFGGADGVEMYIDDFELVQVVVEEKGLLLNGGFEEGLTNWVNWMPDNNIIETNLENVHSGDQSIALTPVSWSGAGYGQSVYSGFEVGKSYILSAYGKISGDIQGKQANISMQFVDADGLPISTYDAPAFSQIDDFEMQSIGATVPEGTSEILASVWFAGPDNTVLYVDDFDLVEGESTPSAVKSNLISADLNFYPNPFIGEILNVNTKGMVGNKQLSIYDLTGKIIFKKSLENNDNHAIHLDASKLNGIYVVLVSSMNSIRSQKLIVY